jgi:hypothetical protein
MAVFWAHVFFFFFFLALRKRNLLLATHGMVFEGVDWRKGCPARLVVMTVSFSGLRL